MFEATYLTSNGDYENFNRATDPSTITPLLERDLKKLWGESFVLKNVRIPRVSTNKDGGLTIQYELNAENIPFGVGETIFLCGRLFGQGVKLNNYVAKLKGDFIKADDIGLVIPVFPYDPKLPALSDIEQILKSPTITDSICAKLNCKTPVTCSFFYNIIGYRLERRAILRVNFEIIDTTGDKFKLSLIAKFFRPNSSKRAFDAFNLLEGNGFNANSADRITTPEILYFDEKNGILLMEYFEGTSLRSLPKPILFNKICGAAGKALRKIHNLSITELPLFSSINEIETLDTRISFLTKIFPSVIEDYKNTVKRLKEKGNFKEDKIKPVCSHRDFYDKQFIYNANRSVVIDCDNLAMADPALDYGNFAAHLELRKTQYPGREELFDSGREYFETAYGNIDDTDFKQRANWYEAASLTRLSMLYLLRPNWSDISPYILQKACSLLS